MAGSIEFPRGPQGQKRSADGIRFAEILTGEVKEDTGDSGKDKATQSMGRGRGAARRDKLTPERRAEIARKSAANEWSKGIVVRPNAESCCMLIFPTIQYGREN